VAQQSQNAPVPGLVRFRVPALVQGVISRGQGQKEIKKGGADAEGAPGNRPKLGSS
jgi:hypothetical protein